jgi:hypothetical protein
MRLRVVTAMTRRGIGAPMNLADLSILLADADRPAPTPGGELHKQVRYLGKIGVLGLEEVSREPAKAVCRLLDDGILADLADLSAQAREETLAD